MGGTEVTEVPACGDEEETVPDAPHVENVDDGLRLRLLEFSAADPNHQTVSSLEQTSHVV